MLWLPGTEQHRVIHNMGTTGADASHGTSVTSGGSTNTYGTATELISAANNTQDSWGIMIGVTAVSTAGGVARQAALDILIGGATDDVLISSLLCGNPRSQSFTINYFFPLHIPQGKRIAASLSGVVASENFRVVCMLYGSSHPPFRTGRKVTTYGTKINNSRGVAVTPTASGGAASVTEIVASTTEDHFAVLPGFQCSTDSTMSNSRVNIGIGIGASTEDRLGTWWWAFSSFEESMGPFPAIPAFHPIPSGSRLTMLASNVTTNDAAYDGLIYAVS